MTAALETSAQMVQLVPHNEMVTHVNACLGMVDSCVRLILMNVLQTLASMVSAEMGSTGTFVIAMLATGILTVTKILTIANPGESMLKVCFKNGLVQLELFSIECGKTKTKVITLANHKGRRAIHCPIKTQSARKLTPASHNWFWFYLRLVLVVLLIG